MIKGVYVRSVEHRKKMSLIIKKLYREGYINPLLNTYHSEKAKQKMAEARIGRKYSEESKLKMSISQKKLYVDGYINPNYGNKISEEQKRKISISQKKLYREGYINPFFGKTHTEKTKHKLRISRIAYMKSNGVYTPTIGKKETQILDYIELINNITIIRQYEVLGYFLDGYDFMNNTAYEIDEPYHFSISKSKKDIERQTNIEKYLYCNFIRISSV